MDKDTKMLLGLGVVAYFFLGRGTTINPATGLPTTTSTNPLTSLLNSLLNPTKPSTGSGSSGGGIGGGSGGGTGGGVSSQPGSPTFTGPATPFQQLTNGSPCDPNSMAYDMSQCFPGMPGYVDSEDPCDPNSTAYDETTCEGLVASSVDTSSQIPDSGDPCDPTSVMYDPFVCADSGE